MCSPLLLLLLLLISVEIVEKTGSREEKEEETEKIYIYELTFSSCSSSQKNLSRHFLQIFIIMVKIIYICIILLRLKKFFICLIKKQSYHAIFLYLYLFNSKQKIKTIYFLLSFFVKLPKNLMSIEQKSCFYKNIPYLKKRSSFIDLNVENKYSSLKIIFF